MYNRTDVMLLYDGSFEGLMTCIFDCYYNKISPIDITPYDKISQFVLCENIYIDTDMEKYERVYSAIGTGISYDAQDLVRLAFLCHTPNSECTSSEIIILNFLKVGFKLKSKIMNNYSCDEFVAINKRVSHISRESHLIKGFVRFALVENLLFATISPKNNVLPLIATHFVDRYKNEMFIIYDDVHSLALIYKPFSYVIVDAIIDEDEYTTGGCNNDNDDKYNTNSYSNSSSSSATTCSGVSNNGSGSTSDINTTAIALPSMLVSSAKSLDEQKYQRLWKIFYDSIAIEGRYNPKCRMSHMPKRFWHNLTELKDEV